MNSSRGRFCQLYRPIGALILALIVLILLLRSCVAPTAGSPTPPAGTPEAAAPTAIPPTAIPPTAVPPTTAPPTAAPTSAPPTAAPATYAIPKINAPAAGDFTADGVALSGAGQPGATVEVWDGATRVGTATVGADGTWRLTAKLAEGPHTLTARTLDAAGKQVNASAALDVTMLKGAATPTLNRPAAGDFTADGVALSGTGQPGATIEVWDGATRVGTATVGADGTWRLAAKLAEGPHALTARTVDAAGKTVNESAAAQVVVPATATPTPAPSPTPTPGAGADLAASGEDYIVVSGDWLITLADKFYGDPDLYTRIVEGTNAKAATDPSYRKITNPNLIYPGQKLWIPPKP